MKEWYRRKSWSELDETEFFAKLNRARKDGRAQYLKIQAIELIMTEDKNLLKVAESLLTKMLSEYPDDNFNKAGALKSLGDVYRLQDDYLRALSHYKQAIDFQIIYPSVVTNAALDFSELAVKHEQWELYEYVEHLITQRINRDTLIFENEKYISYSILSILNKYKGNKAKARQYADLAETSVKAKTSGLRYHKTVGIVTHRLPWLDNMVRNNINKPKRKFWL